MNEMQNDKHFLQMHKLPQAYLETARCYFDPIVDALVAGSKERQSKPLLISLSGCQGSGKSTLADYLCYSLTKQGINAISVSLDDFYLSKAEREKRALTVHPLFRTRGVPGTHNTQRLIDTLLSAKEGGLSGLVIPQFDKSCDDLFPEDAWVTVADSPAVFILEGWCMGAEAQEETELLLACNDFEATMDPEGKWRHLVNEFLKADYHKINSLFDVQLFLKAPSFESVFEWRLEQEEKLLQKLSESSDDSPFLDGQDRGMSREQVREFIQYYQRITESLLSNLASKADVVWELDQKRHIISHSVSEKLQKYMPYNKNELERKVD